MFQKTKKNFRARSFFMILLIILSFANFLPSVRAESDWPFQVGDVFRYDLAQSTNSDFDLYQNFTLTITAIDNAGNATLELERVTSNPDYHSFSELTNGTYTSNQSLPGRSSWGECQTDLIYPSYRRNYLIAAVAEQYSGFRSSIEDENQAGGNLTFTGILNDLSFNFEIQGHTSDLTSVSLHVKLEYNANLTLQEYYFRQEFNTDEGVHVEYYDLHIPEDSAPTKSVDGFSLLFLNILVILGVSTLLLRYRTLKEILE